MLSKLKERLWSMRGTIIRAAIFAVAWGVAPFWFFLLVALYLFFVPPAQAGTVIAPFIVLLGFAFFSPVSFLMAIIFGLLFWYILLIKELYLINRRVAYETLSLVLVFLIFRLFYERLGAGFAGPAPFLFALLIAGTVGFLFSGFAGLFMAPAIALDPETHEGSVKKEEIPITMRRLRRVAAAAIAFLIFEILLAGLFLPLDFVYQTVIVFILAALILDLSARHLLEGSVPRERILVLSSTAFVLLAVILGSARWGL